VNTPGTIDSGYRGELKVCLINLDPAEPVTLPAGSRIAQLVIQEVTTAQFIQVQELDETERSDKGFGSTGIST
jgi:dUTP pyrophosphatase